MEFFTGFLLGLSNSVYCIGICAPVLLPYLLSEGRKPIYPVLKFMTGRLFAYVVFALATGIIGIYFEGKLNPRIFSILVIILAAWLIIYGLGKMNPNLSFCKWAGKSFSGKNLPFYSGIVMGLNVCPPFLLGITQTMQMASILKPVIFFSGFYIGSSLWMVLFLFMGNLAQKSEVQIIGRLTSILVGLWFLVQGILALI